MPLPRNCDERAGGRSGRHVHVERAGRSVDLERAAEHQRRERHGHVDVEVVALALEDLVRLDVDDDVEIAGRAAGRAVLALAAEAAAAGRRRCRPGCAPSRGDRCTVRPGAAAGRARRADDLARHRRTGRMSARRRGSPAGSAADRGPGTADTSRATSPARRRIPCTCRSVSSRGIWIVVSAPA